MSAPFLDNDLVMAARIHSPTEDRRVAPSPSALSRFVRTPLGWVLIALVIGTSGAEGYIREHNRKSCATVAMLIDRQGFLNEIGRGANGVGGAATRIIGDCRGFTTTDTYQLPN